MSENRNINTRAEIQQLLDSLENIYFLGIGGIGMSALARYFHSKGKKVSGFDRTKTPLTTSLEKSGIDIHYEENISLIPKDISLLIYTPAIPADNEELKYLKKENVPMAKRSEVLGWITEPYFSIGVAGTHGKTTISTMIAHILTDCGLGCHAFLGGISINYNSNFWSSDSNYCVVEADEYDRSFLKLSPNVAIISAMDADHLDIYGDANNLENAFIAFSKKIKKNGCLINKYGLKRSADILADHHYQYSINNTEADIYASEIKIEHGTYHYNIKASNWSLNDVQLSMGGLHNIENSLAAIAVAKFLNIDDHKIKNAIKTFKGVKRRFEFIIRDEKHILIDDYAHHPEELKALITSAKNLFPNEKCLVVFQPHLYSRTKDFAAEFAACLGLADEVILLPIYPARELPMEGVSSDIILNQIKIKSKKLLNKQELLNWIKTEDPGFLIMCGAGDIDRLIIDAKEILMQNK